MVEEIYKNIYRIGVALPGNPLKELNSYFIRGEDDDHDILIDAGFRRTICQEALEEGLKQIGSETARRQMLVTHLHSDHSGMADLFVGPGQPVYMSETDLSYLSRLYTQELSGTRYNRFIEEGFSAELLEEMYKKNPAFTEGIPSLNGFVPVKDKEEIRVGEYILQSILVPGHTPGNTMYYIKDKKIMFTGDHILFDISPNITYWPGVPDSLGSYLDSLNKALEYDVEIAFPGHRQTGDYKERIKALLIHHERRLANAMSIIEQYPGKNAYDITGLMKWKIHARNWEEFPVVQKWFAVGECLAHLDYLMNRGKVRRELSGSEYKYYIA